MTTEPIFYEPVPMKTLEERMKEVIREEIRNTIEYVDECYNCRDDVLVFHRPTPSQEYVEMCALMRILTNYRQLKEQTRLQVVK